MNEGKNERRRGTVRISLQSIMRALYGDTDYKAINMRIDRYDANILAITVEHDNLPITKKGFKYPSVIIRRTEIDEQ